MHQCDCRRSRRGRRPSNRLTAAQRRCSTPWCGTTRAFEVLEFRIGRTNDEPSFVSMRVTAPAEEVLSELLAELVGLGCSVARVEDAHTIAADRDGCAPDDFYSTTNHQTFIRRERAMGARRAPAHGRRDRGRERTCRVPQAARDPARRRRRLRDPRHQDRPGVPGARSPRLRVHDRTRSRPSAASRSASRGLPR